MIEKSVEIPIGDCELSVTCGSDGVWLHFGNYTMIHVANHFGKGTGAIPGNIRRWCADREEAAAVIKEQYDRDNSQFGVGA